MADSNGYVQSVIDGSYEFYKKSLKQFSWYKKIYGTKCQVQRVKEDSKYSEVLGTMYSNNLKNSTEVEKFNYIVIINMNRMVKVYNESSDTIDFYDNESILKLGDVLVFTRRGREFRFKITDIMTFSEVGGLLNQYTMTPYIVVDTKESSAALERPGENAFVVTQDQLQSKVIELGSDLPEEVKPDLGFTALSEVKLDVDSNIINPGNIRTGVKVLGVNGEFDGKYSKATELVVTENGEYLPEDYDVDAFSKVDVDVQPTLEELTITENGTFTPQDGVDGFRKVVANVVPTRKVVLPNGAKITNTQIIDGYWAGELVDTSTMTNMSSMFANCSQLQNLDVSNWDISSVTMINYMFNGCSQLRNLDVSNWEVKGVTNSEYMFVNCSQLQNLDVSNWDVSSITYMTNMFLNCSQLQNLDVSNWDVRSIKGMSWMFYNCSRLQSIIGNRTIDDVLANNISALNGLKVSLSLSSTILDRASLRAVINGLADLTGQTAQTLTLGTTLIAKLTEEDIAIATTKNWTIA